MTSILVMDDDQHVQAVLRGILEEAGSMVVIASNGQQGDILAVTPLDSRAVMTNQQGAPRAAVLIVDDDPDICEVLTDLVRYEGDDAEHAWAGTDALAKIQQAAFSAVIHNVHLPEQDGRIVLLERRERDPVSPVIAFIVKPYTKTERLEILRRATGRTKGLRSQWRLYC